MNHVLIGITACIASVCVITRYMINILAAVSAAPSQTRSHFHFQMISTRCPRGIFNAQGSPAQKARPAM